MATRLNWRLLIGEFVVIVVGVLMALWVDDWRARRADQALARHLVESVADDLRADITELEAVLGDARSVGEASERLLKGSDPSTWAADIAAVAGGIDFDLSDVAYREMMSSGSSQVLPNDLRREISQYYWLVQSFNVAYATFEEHRIGLHRALVRLGIAPLRPEVEQLEAAISDPEVRALVAELGARGDLMTSVHEGFLEAASALLAEAEAYVQHAGFAGEPQASEQEDR
jgi:hypothetical protein